MKAYSRRLSSAISWACAVTTRVQPGHEPGTCLRLVNLARLLLEWNLGLEAVTPTDVFA